MSSQYTKQKRVMEDPGDLPVEKKIIRDDDAGAGAQDRGGKDTIPRREGRSRNEPPTSTTPKAITSQQNNSSNNRRARRHELLLQIHMNEYDEQSEEDDDDDVDLDMVPGAHRVGATGESALYESMYTHGTNNSINGVPPAPPPQTTAVVAHLATDIEELEGENRRLAQQLADITNAEVVGVETKAAGCSMWCSNLTKKTLMMIVTLAFILIGLIFAIALGIRLNGSNDSRGGRGGEQVQLTTATTTPLPTPHPTTPPTRSPTLPPTFPPVVPPTPAPTGMPTPLPTVPPTAPPTAPPTGMPTPPPTTLPTSPPTQSPTTSPTKQPTPTPTGMPTPPPTTPPTSPPTQLPTPHPTTAPTRLPTLPPTLPPTVPPTPPPTHMPTPLHTVPPTTPPTSAPTSVPSSSPTSSPVASYLKSVVAPPGGSNFDHFEENGLTINDESNIDKIRQIQVYAIVFCSTNNDCSLPTSTQICLVTTYLLNDCTDSIKREGAYTDTDRNRAGVINLRRDQYVSRIEVFAETYVTHIKICLTDGSCFGPYGSSLDVEPNYIFEEPDSVIKALHGASGSWLDRIGVIFEQNFHPDNPDSNSCG